MDVKHKLKKPEIRFFKDERKNVVAIFMYRQRKDRHLL